MKKFKWLIIISGVLILFFLFGSWYLEKVYLPVKLKTFLIKTIETHTQRKTIIENIHYSFSKGIVIHNLIIFEKSPKPDEIFLKVNKINFNCLFIPLVKNGKVIVPVLHIDGLYINIIRDKENTLNFKDIFANTKASAIKGKAGPFIFIYKIEIANSNLKIEDNFITPSFTTHISGLNINIKFIPIPTMRFKIAANIKNTNDAIPFLCNGEFNYSKNNLSLDMNVGNLRFLDYSNYLVSLKPIEIKDGLCKLDIKAYSAGLKDIRVNLTADIKGIDLVKNKYRFKTDTTLTLNLDYIFGKGLSSLKYKGQFLVKDANLVGLKYFPNVKNINGLLSFDVDNLYTENLKGTSYGSDLVVSGYLKNFKNPSMEITLTVDSDLSQIKNNLNDNIKDKLKNLEFEGRLTGKINMAKDFSKDTPLNMSAQLSLINTILKYAKLTKSIGPISGDVKFDNESISTKGLNINFDERNYVLNLVLVDFNNPNIKVALKTEDFNLDTTLISSKEGVEIQNLVGKFRSTSFRFLGDTTGWQPPQMNIYGEVNLDIGDLKYIFPKISNMYEKTQLKGNCNIAVYFNGPLTDRKNWELGIKTNSGVIHAWGLNFGTPTLDFRLKDNKIEVPKMILTPYNGTITSVMNIDLGTEAMPYTISIDMSNVDLTELMKDTDFKDKDISGKLFSKFDLSGSWKDSSTMSGNGEIHINEGRLFKAPWMVGLTNLLLLHGSEKIIFNEASGTFMVSNKKISTADAKLTSKEASISFKGDADFDGNLDFVVNATVAKEIIDDLPKFGKIISFVVDETGKFIGEIKLEGTVKEPIYSFRVLPVKDIFKKLFR